MAKSSKVSEFTYRFALKKDGITIYSVNAIGRSCEDAYDRAMDRVPDHPLRVCDSIEVESVSGSSIAYFIGPLTIYTAHPTVFNSSTFSIVDGRVRKALPTSEGRAV